MIRYFIIAYSPNFKFEFTPFCSRQMAVISARAGPVSKEALFFRFFEAHAWCDWVGAPRPDGLLSGLRRSESVDPEREGRNGRILRRGLFVRDGHAVALRGLAQVPLGLPELFHDGE
jgi:hypothetical protein